MSERSQTRLATQEDLDRLFGSQNLMIGFPVRPPSGGDAPAPQPASPAEQPEPPVDE